MLVETSEKLKVERLMFLHRSLHNPNDMVCNMALEITMKTVYYILLVHTEIQ